MKLRRWQDECLNLALSHYTQYRHFLCLATPGAGKTVFAAELARRMKASHQIDLVLCFSPSVAVAAGLRQAMEERLSRRLDGALGAVGGSYTYQNLMFFKSEFWSMLEHHRVLVIFDEIHHCSGTTPDNANAWGEEILLRIQDKAAFTLALTGTPWRSDKAPIVLSRYQGPEGRIQVDYQYGLRDAIQDDVCRTPKISLIENDHVSITDPDANIRIFSSLSELFAEEGSAYTVLIQQEQAIRYMLASASMRLENIRLSNPDAAGLVIASSVMHAKQIAQILQSDGCQVTVVSYHHPDSAAAIQQFRSGTSSWIVSVGMISEGTDIPRLQVCCYLSAIKTELHYRQVLGRVLRRTAAFNQEAWLYTFAEPKLVEYANRIAEDVPEIEVVVRDTRPSLANPFSILMGNHSMHDGIANQTQVELSQVELASHPSETHMDVVVKPALENTYSWGAFREAVLATFNSPFSAQVPGQNGEHLT